MSKYLNEFLSLRCAGDVMNVVGPVNKAAKEITEAMGAIKQIRSIVLKKPMHYTVVDLCSGNALTPVIATHLLPVVEAYAVDKKPRRRHWFQAGRFDYVVADIYADDFIERINSMENVILTSVHPCGELAQRVVDVYNQSSAQHLVMIPCCVGKIGGYFPDAIRKKLGPYLSWSWYLAQSVIGGFRLDPHIKSPCNAVVCASKNMDIFNMKKEDVE